MNGKKRKKKQDIGIIGNNKGILDMVKPIVCEFKNYFVRFDFINCNKFGEIGVFTDY